MGSTRGIMSLIASGIVACSLGCGQDKTTEDSSDTAVTTDTDTVTTDTDTTDTDTETETVTLYATCLEGVVPPVAAPGTLTATYGQRCEMGQAVADEVGYDGTDSVFIFPLLGPYEIGAAACVLSYRLTSVLSRDDCMWGDVKSGDPDRLLCDWAHDLEISEASVQDPFGVCLATVGYDATTVSSLNGAVFARGYHSDYSGHATVKMEIINEAWRSAGYVTYDDVTNALSYADVVGNAFAL